MTIRFQKMPWPLAMIALCACAFAQDSLPRVDKKIIQVGNTRQSYYLYVPASDGKTPMPLIVLMHGAGGNGLEQVTAWKSVADANHIILIAPNIRNTPADWDQLYDHPQWIRDAINDVGRKYSLDQHRMYLWGYSAGGMFTFYFAFLESRYFAAAAVHGGVIENFKYQMADFADRKIPFAYYIGTKDQWWSAKQARATLSALTSRGFTVHYVELKGADHNFYARHEEITRDAWKFMKQYALHDGPYFAPLDLAKIKASLK